jgi:NDP-sugar pyrophosphorylase family protein/aminoglycoside/choline kinase family phosphotransferase
MIKAFILAAGYSKRLRPISEHIPKPLMPIAGEILLEYIYKNLRSLTKHIGINLHYKAKEIEEHIKNHHLSLHIFYEKEILLTGGALWNARQFLKDSHFIVHNGDIYWDGNIKEAVEWHIESKNSITLITHEHKPQNKLIIDKEGNLLRIDSSNNLSPTEKRVAFCGVAIYSPQILELLPEGPSSIIDVWIKAIKEGLKIKTFKANYNFWFDIGTPNEYARAVFHNLKRNFTSLFVHSTVSGCELIEFSGNVVIEKNVKIKKPFKAKNIIILPETEFNPESENISNSIFGKNYRIPIKIPIKESLTLSGSDREYFRKNGRVFCKWKKLSEDFEKNIFLGKFLKEKNFPVPEIIKFDKNNKIIIFEDLGDLTLYSWLQCKRNDKEIEKIYKIILEKIGKLHWEISKESTNLNLPEFDYSYFRWESDYFLKECVEEVFKIKYQGLEDELHFIADTLSKTQKVILHRDLQSQNIMLKNGEIYFIDYQSARMGPAGYDIASLIWDPYVKLNNELRKKLVNFYIKHCNLQDISFLKELSLCRIQRHMQALGAYGFLASKKGKKSFLKFIPYGLSLLIGDFEECYIDLPRIKNLVLKLKNLIYNSSCRDFFII